MFFLNRVNQVKKRCFEKNAPIWLKFGYVFLHMYIYRMNLDYYYSLIFNLFFKQFNLQKK